MRLYVTTDSAAKDQSEIGLSDSAQLLALADICEPSFPHNLHIFS
jgi:hypothetical protein